MKNFGKLAVLGAALAVSATSAFAIPYTGAINTSDSPVPPSNITVTGSNVAAVVFNGTDTFSQVEPLGSGVGINLGYYTGANVVSPGVGSAYDDTLGNFNTATIANEVLWIGYQTAGAPGYALDDEVEFKATGLLTAVSNPNGAFSFLVAGNFIDEGAGGYTTTAGVDEVTYNTVNGQITEDFSVSTPEPSSLMLLGTGLLGGAGMLMRRRRLTA